MTGPRRIRRSRARGWRMPADAVYVGRPTRWGNPFPVAGAWITWAAIAFGFRADEAGCRVASLHLYRRWLGLEGGAADFELDGGRILIVPGANPPLTHRYAAEVAGIYAAEVRQREPPARTEIVAALGGRDLACWCALDQPCHADVLLGIANAGAR